MVQKQLSDAALLMVRRLDHLLFTEGSEFSQAAREAYEDTIIWELEDLQKQIEALTCEVPQGAESKGIGRGHWAHARGGRLVHGEGQEDPRLYVR